ncbi:hypothetical protein BJX68DRAFT_248299 [Aspergillus pseudodeflectus]|uniref:SnoaL-like domain-containing protein n=1 Tax=Aspergillus pseudodeflectus TaxID=176178 RepID=A0ABR4JG52_9EURO
MYCVCLLFVRALSAARNPCLTNTSHSIYPSSTYTIHMATPKHTPRSILETFYAAERIYMSAPPSSRDFTTLAAVVSPTFRLEQTSALPYAGTYIGPGGFQDWATRMADYFDVVDVRDPEVFERDGSNKVMVLANVLFRVRATGEELLFPFAQAITVDLELGVMTELRPFYWDVAAVNKALGVGQ